MRSLRRLSLLLALLLAACAPASIPTPAPAATASSALAAVADAMPAAADTPTPQFTPAQPTLPLTQAPPALPTSTPGALELYFPTILPVEGAEYRPPLYPIPWALSEHDHFYFSAPIAASYPGEPEWDYRYGGIFFSKDVIHTGVDIPAPRGTEVLAAAPGTVVWAGIGLWSGSQYQLDDPYGKAVAIRHDFGYHDQQLYTVYAHMEEVDVVVGQWVNTGEVVGHVGSTGMTTGPHLHFEVRLGKNDFFWTRNPELWLSPPIGDGVLAGRVTSTFGTLLDSYLVSVKNMDTGKYYQASTYGPQVVNADPYYNENVVIGNLPAGVYELNIPYGALNRIATIQILPGQVTYFAFHGFNLYDFGTPAPTATPTKTP